jgi:chorismate synthase
VSPQIDQLDPEFPVLNPKAASQMQDLIRYAKEKGDSVGGVITCAITGLPAGLGEPMFGGVESRIAQIVYGIPAVKEVSFGDGGYCSVLYGSQINDAFTIENGIIRTVTNHCGGILGGITNGMPVIFSAAFKPTPSISRPQQSVSLSAEEITTLEIKGRHDPCIVPRAVPVVEAAAAIAIYDLILGNTQTSRRKL